MLFAPRYLFFLIAFGIEASSGVRYNTVKGTSKYTYETKYFDTYLDHFTYVKSSQTFKMKYLISTKYWSLGGPIFFYCGNEGSIELFAENSGFIWEFGKAISAMIVFAEHRYYGTSLPFGNQSFSDPDHFGYLTAEQALADYANLIKYLKETVTYADKSAVIAFGGSYGGMLAAWFRQKYPNVVAGALAASAPVLMVSNTSHCNSAYQVLTRAYQNKGSKACVDNIRSFWKVLSHMNSSSQALNNLTKIFRTCTPLKNVQPLIDQISEALFDMGMANYPYPTSFLNPMPAWPVREFCKSLSTPITEPLKLSAAVATGIQVYFNYTGQMKCLPVSSEDSSQSPGLDANGWYLQTCTELPMPMCQDGVTDMFIKNDFNKTLNDIQCQQSYSVKPRWNWGQTQFWGNELSAASNIIYSNGLLDPWSGGGVFYSDKESVVIIIIENGAHHLDLRESNPNDPQDVIKARTQEVFHIIKWIGQWNRKRQ